MFFSVFPFPFCPNLEVLPQFLVFLSGSSPFVLGGYTIHWTSMQLKKIKEKLKTVMVKVSWTAWAHSPSVISPAGSGARNSGQRLPVFYTGVGHRAFPGRADGGDGDKPEGGRAPGRRHDTPTGAGGRRAAEKRKRPRRARPIRRPHTLPQGWWRSNGVQVDFI